MLQSTPSAQQQQQQQDLNQPASHPSTHQTSFPHKLSKSKGTVIPFLSQNSPHYPFQGQGIDQQQLHPPSTPVLVEDAGVTGMGANDGNQALMRPPLAHRSPNSRAKWSPVVHTIAVCIFSSSFFLFLFFAVA